MTADAADSPADRDTPQREVATTAHDGDIMRGAYTLVVTRDPEGSYSSEVLEFPGCFSGGDTAAEAVSNLERAMELWIESELEEGRPIPAPTGAAGLAGSLRYEDGDAADQRRRTRDQVRQH